MLTRKMWKTAILSIAAGAVAIGFASAETKTTKILKAKAPIAKGQSLTNDMFEIAEVREDQVWMVRPEARLDGYVAKHDLAANEYLSKQDLSRKRVVTFGQNEREYTVQTDLSRCVGGDLEAGDLADVLFFDKGTFSAQPIFTVSILEVKNRAGDSLHGGDKQVRDTVPATVKIKVTVEQAAALLTFEQRGLIAFARIPDELAEQVVSP